MSGTILDYLKEYGNVPFSERPFCDADSMVLSQLAYLKFDGLVPDPDSQEDSGVPLAMLAKDPDREKMFADVKYRKHNRLLFERLLAGRRFRDLTLFGYRSITDLHQQTQFAAVTFVLRGSLTFVAFRGTDETMVGWKEDFNLTYMDEIPAQRFAVEYLSIAASKIPVPFFVGGHSKGGHLAIYAVMHSVPEIQDRVRRIYCLDGPGFFDRMLDKESYEKIRGRITKLLPQSSLIGMLQQQDDDYRVVKSHGVGLLQHNLYNWKVENGELEYEEELKGHVRTRDNVINDWIYSQPPQRRKEFVDSLYQVITSCDADNRIDFMANFSKNVSQVMNSLRGLDEETAQMIRNVTKALFEEAAYHFRSELGFGENGQWEQLIEELRKGNIPKWKKQ
ncbi:MAG: DUF2974 domain-containing protein [Lachnospiraceae bacterium]|nr:DUF2974 domain-containing protein [Lachnospiraceae bacterium]